MPLLLRKFFQRPPEERKLLLEAAARLGFLTLKVRLPFGHPTLAITSEKHPHLAPPPSRGRKSIPAPPLSSSLKGQDPLGLPSPLEGEGGREEGNRDAGQDGGWATNDVPPLSEPDTATTLAQRLARAVQTAARRIPGATCLVQAMALKAMLERRGLPATVCIGVSPERHDPHGLHSHAWVETAGGLRLDPAADHFIPMATLEARRCNSN